MTREELELCLKEDRVRNLEENSKSLKFVIQSRLSKNPCMVRYRFLVAYRKSEFYTGIRKAYYLRKKNRLGMVLGYEFLTGCKIGPGLKLCHGGPIIINSHAVIGRNATMRGACCIGNLGTIHGAPVIGDGVEFGFGATVIGNIRVADHTWIAAGAVLNRNVTEPWTVVGGVPAKQVSVIAHETVRGKEAEGGVRC